MDADSRYSDSESDTSYEEFSFAINDPWSRRQIIDNFCKECGEHLSNNPSLIGGWCRECLPDTCVACHETLDDEDGVEAAPTEALRAFVNRQRDERIAANFEDRYSNDGLCLLCQDCWVYYERCADRPESPWSRRRSDRWERSRSRSREPDEAVDSDDALE